ncbi:zinc finger CCCH domain-containing protein 7-like [Salvia splendens]|uniref:zinc finger CCCH domain-containing protein 7-like n=1 Tax=Salvia splendens TaxID=180675 RepID=UPI001C271972|nr:zinc finger CCCH domain-containing protein 7-like [Salvia splendens]XP_042026794.1 zinc finger CCCH domain-containing protein 7-like [Salvia splendens]
MKNKFSCMTASVILRALLKKSLINETKLLLAMEIQLQRQTLSLSIFWWSFDTLHFIYICSNGNGNQLIRDPKIRVRVLASEKVRWSLLTARLRLARKSKYCQFFTRFGKCNKDDVKCLCIHDPSKVVVCTKFQAGSCTNVDCISTHKVIPERMQGCSYFLKGLCSNDNCPYRHVHVNPDSSVCENFLRGYCADGNECQKKHTYTCPAFEPTGVSPQASTCKLHHPKTKTEKKPRIEHKVVRGRYFDGGLIGVDDWSSASAVEKLSTRGKVDIVVYKDNSRIILV